MFARLVIQFGHVDRVSKHVSNHTPKLQVLCWVTWRVWCNTLACGQYVHRVWPLQVLCELD